jgi:hypothetical protein
MGRGYCHRGGKVKGFRFAPMNQDVWRSAVFLKRRATRLILWRVCIRHSLEKVECRQVSRAWRDPPSRVAALIASAD